MPETDIDLSHTLNQILTVATRRRRWIALPASGVALGTILVSTLLSNRYRSEATILVEPQKAAGSIRVRFRRPRADTSSATPHPSSKWMEAR
jgi:uncharacterized protein involved in exopolysaccharide biosynthesis